MTKSASVWRWLRLAAGMPQVAWTLQQPAAFAAPMSAGVSPTRTHCSGRAPSRSSASSTPSGCGLWFCNALEAHADGEELAGSYLGQFLRGANGSSLHLGDPSLLSDDSQLEA